MINTLIPVSRSVALVTRGVMRFLRSLDRSGLSEVVLASQRRADILSIGPKGEIWIIETKSSVVDLRADHKWPDYRAYCDRFFFAADASVPFAIFPENAGFIIADGYGAEILREAPHHPLQGARRKEILIRVARIASNRMQAQLDPGLHTF